MKTTCHFIDNGSASRFIHWLICAAIFIACSEAMPQTPRSCETELKAAEQKYVDGYLDEAVDLLNGCLNNPNAANRDKAEAYQLLGKIYIAKDNRDEAKRAFAMMLTLNPAANLDATKETSEVMSIFNEVKTELPKEPPTSETPQSVKKGGGKKWLWIGGGGLVAAGITTVILLKKPPPVSDGGFTQPIGRPR